MIDVVFGTEHADGCVVQREAQLGRRHSGVDVLRRDAVRLGQRFAQRLHRVVVVEAVERDEVLEFRAQVEIQAGEVPHRRRRQAVQLVRQLGLRMRRIHGGVHPDRADGDVLKNGGIEPRDVILVLVGHHQQIEAFLPAAGVWQHRLEIADRGRQVARRADRAAVDQDVKVVDLIADLSGLRDAAVEAVADLDVVGAD